MSPSTSLGAGLTLYAHPFSSYCWKVQIPLDANGTPYDLSQPRSVRAGRDGGAQEALADRQVSGAGRRWRSDRRSDLHHRTSAGPASGSERVDSGRRRGPAGSLPRSLLRPSHPGQHAAVGQPRDPAGGLRRRLWRRAGTEGAAHRLRLARSEPARQRMGGRRTVHARRLRRRPRPVLRRLGRRDRRHASAAEGLSGAAARPSGGAKVGRGRAAVPRLFPARRARPRSKRRRATSEAADRLR